MRENVSKPVSFVVALLILAVLVAPTAFAGAAEAPRATSSAAKVSKALQKLKTQVAVLRQQIGALENQTGAPRTPNGAAGGDLTGAYPNPLIGPNAVGALEIQSNAVGADEMQDNSVGAGEIQNAAVGSAELAGNSIGSLNLIDGAVSSPKISDESVTAADLGVNSVGSFELQPLTAHVSAGVTITKTGGARTVPIVCPAGRTLISGGYAWQDDGNGVIIVSAPSEADPTGIWVVRGRVDEGSNRLFAWATCLLG